jgi:RNA polymerase sigma-54 factor
MATQMQLEITPHPAMHMRPSAMLVGLAEILALPSLEMERAVAQELEDNPALERVAEAACGFCGGRASACPVCGTATDRRTGRPARHPGSDRLDGAANLPSEERPEQVLLRDVLTLLPGDDRALAELVVGSLDERGFLGEAPADLARRLHVAPDRVCRIVAALREVGHPGIAAVDLRESLILQLDSLSGQGLGESSQGIVTERGQGIVMLTRRIVTGHLTALGQGRFSAIAQALGVSADDVREARAFIQRALSPSPAERVCAERWAAPRRIPALPDLVIVERADKPGHYAVELAEAIRCAVRVDPAWRAAADAAITDHDGNSVRALVRRADGFLAKLERRWRTLRLIGTYLVDRQRGFIQHGPSSMVSLTRAETARAVSLSESMVSRAVAGKFAMMPAGRVMPLADFFDCSLRVRAELSRLITAEERPLSDSELACLLHRRGYDVARRTVAKYRDRLGILPAGLR